MAKGYPDFFGYSMFPYYGGPYLETGNVITAGAGLATVLTIAAKGIVRGGSIIAILPNVTDIWGTYIYADGQLVQVIQYDSGYTEYDNIDNFSCMTLDYLSMSQLVARFNIKEGISFQDELTLRIYRAVAAADYSADARIVYHRIEA